MDATGALSPADAFAALEHLPVALGVVDAGGLIRYVNPAAERLYGWRAEEVIGKSALALSVAPSDTAAAADLLARLQMGESWTGRFPVTRPDGVIFNAWFGVVPLPGPDGAGGGLLSVSHDAREIEPEGTPALEAAEARAEEANLLVESLLHSVPLGLAFFDRSLRYVRVNAALAEINGLPAEAHVGLPISRVLDVIPPDVEDDLRTVFATGRPALQREVSGQTPRSPGETRHWTVNYFPVSRGGEVLWVGASVVDVTESYLAERERERLFEAERRARLAAEQSAERLARLQAVTARLAEVSDVTAVAELVVKHATEGVGASGGAMAVLEGETLEFIHLAGMAPAAADRFRRVSLDAGLPATDAVRRQEVIFLRSVAERDERYPALAEVAPQNRSFAAVPMLVEGRVVGCVVFGWSEERAFDDEDGRYLLALSRQAGQALERSRLYEAERRSRAAAEQASERVRFLAEASRVLSSSLDYEVTLSELARLAVPEVATGCVVHLLEGSTMRLVVVAHEDPVKRDILVRMTERPPSTRGPVLLGRVAMTGESLVFPEVPEELWHRLAENDDQLRDLLSLDVASAAVVALRIQDRVLGVLTLVSGSARHRFAEEDLAFVEDLAGRAAVAIENSRAHRTRTEVAQTLQQSLLPPSLPRIAGLDLAQRYHPLADDVGGDFYDLFPAGDGRWGVVIGDVCGKGVAAASLTALARYTVRAAAIENEPDQVLRVLNRAVLDSDTDERFCTLAHAMIEAVDDGLRVRLACGGHPLPVLVGPDGSIRPVGTPGSAVGLFEEVEISSVDLVVAPGEALVLYTDGFIEARTPDGAFDAGLLNRTLSAAAAAGGTAEDLAEAVERAFISSEAGEQRDDMALLILRVPA